MSLIHARREQQGGLYRPVKPPSTFRLLAMLVLVFAAIWYLSRLAG